MSNQPCKYCGIDITRWEKLPDGKYLRYDKNGLHKYDICKAEQLKRHKTSYQPNHQAQITRVAQGTTSNYVGGTSTFPVNEEPKTQGVTIFSLHVTISELRREIKEMRKQIETLASIIDSMAQKQDLMIERVGYPKPEPIVKVATKEDREMSDQVMKKIRDESGVLLKDGQEIKAVQSSLSPDEVNVNQTTRTREDVAMQFLNKTDDIMQWQNLSEAFVCHNCEGKFHNGFYKLGTRLCLECKNKVESNESEDRSDVNSFRERSIEDINEDI